MADVKKRTKKARKQAAKRAKATRKSVARMSSRAKAQAAAGLLVAAGACAAVAKLLKGKQPASVQRYSPEPDNLPNSPDRPAGTTPPPGAGTRATGSDTGSQTETERARLDQTG
jgi:hypothetical protein